jgi:hypothetical protein
MRSTALPGLLLEQPADELSGNSEEVGDDRSAEIMASAEGTFLEKICPNLTPRSLRSSMEMLARTVSLTPPEHVQRNRIRLKK